MHRKKKNMLKVMVALLVTIVLIAVLAVTLDHLIYKKIKSKLADLKIQTTDVSLDLIGRSVALYNVSWTYPDTAITIPPHSLNVRKVEIKGIHIIPLILHKRLHANYIDIDSGRIQVNKHYLPSQSSDQKAFNPVALSIDLLEINNFQFMVWNDTTLELRGVLDLTIGGTQLPDITDKQQWLATQFDFFKVQLGAVRFHQAGTLYATEVSQILADSKTQSLTVDSLLLVPLVSKYEFARKKGKQTDWITLSVPQILVTGIDLSRRQDSIIHVLDVDIRDAKMHIFRDKRVKFIPGKDIPLPMAIIRKLPFTAAIDSIHVRNANIFHEIFPEQGFHPGHITFENLEATLDHLSNHKYYMDFSQATLIARANMMEQGAIAASFSLPYDSHQRYRAKGAITHLPLPLLNPMLENLAFTRILSGKMNRLSFDFNYDELKSTGSILIDYENLKIQSLTKDRNATPKELKSFLLNVLLRNDKDKEVPKEKRTGEIAFEPNRKKAVFNLWVKSILDGLEKSVIDL